MVVRIWMYRGGSHFILREFHQFINIQLAIIHSSADLFEKSSLLAPGKGLGLRMVCHGEHLTTKTQFDKLVEKDRLVLSSTIWLHNNKLLVSSSPVAQWCTYWSSAYFLCWSVFNENPVRPALPISQYRSCGGKFAKTH